METRTLLILTLCTLLVAVFIVILMVFRSAMANHSARLDSIPSQVYSSEHGDIEYLLQGDGPIILVSHGITGGVDQGMGLSEDYLGSGYRLLLVSRFGYLKSTVPENPSPELQADVYRELLDHLGIERAFIFGNSAGATSAIQFAIRHPEACSGLILVSPNAPLNESSGHPPLFIFKSNFVYWSIMKLFGRSMTGMFVPKDVFKKLPKQEKKRIIEGIYFSALPVTRRTGGIEFDLFVSNPSINDDVPFESVKSPTLIINAIDDPATLIEGARTLAGNIPNSKLVTFDTGGHILLGRGGEIKNQVREFMGTS